MQMRGNQKHDQMHINWAMKCLYVAKGWGLLIQWNLYNADTIGAI